MQVQPYLFFDGRCEEAIKTARKFYEGTLDLKPVSTQGEELVAYRSGSSTILVYRSDYAGRVMSMSLQR